MGEWSTDMDACPREGWVAVKGVQGKTVFVNPMQDFIKAVVWRPLTSEELHERENGFYS